MGWAQGAQRSVLPAKLALVPQRLQDPKGCQDRLQYGNKGDQSPYPIAVLTASDPHLPGEIGDSSAETNWHRKMSQSLSWLWAECLFLRLPCVMTLVLK